VPFSVAADAWASLHPCALGQACTGTPLWACLSLSAFECNVRLCALLHLSVHFKCVHVCTQACACMRVHACAHISAYVFERGPCRMQCVCPACLLHPFNIATEPVPQGNIAGGLHDAALLLICSPVSAALALHTLCALDVRWHPALVVAQCLPAWDTQAPSARLHSCHPAATQRSPCRCTSAARRQHIGTCTPRQGWPRPQKGACMAAWHLTAA